MDKIINTKKWFKVSVIVYAFIIVLGLIISLIAGVKLDINFSGGTKISYSYDGEISEKDFKTAVSDALNKDFTLSKNTSLTGNQKSYVVTLVGNDALSAEAQNKLSAYLAETFADNNVSLYDATSVSPTIAGAFFKKSIAAIILTAILVTVYVGIRFRKIGGISAALSAFVALIFDLLTAFFACIVFRLPIDSNFIAVVLTILGYSLNDTIVIFDRIRENRRVYNKLSIRENVDRSVGETFVRNIVTTLTTVCAVLTIIVVSELCGITTLRSFAIPMTFGLISGCFSSLFISTPIWVVYKEKFAKK